MNQPDCPTDIRVSITDIELSVLKLRRQYQAVHRDKPEPYWLDGLVEEVRGLTTAVNGEHGPLAELKLRQIAAICINWLEMIKEKQ